MMKNRSVLFAAAAFLAAAAAGSSGAFAQSAGSFSAAVSNVAIVPTIVCDAGVTTTTNPLSCDNTATDFCS
jgi:ABC-type sugar transport system substrate-binding protein